MTAVMSFIVRFPFAKSCTRPSAADVSPEASACVGEVKDPGRVLQPCFAPVYGS